MRERDLVITGATLTLIIYTIFLSFTGQALSATQTKRTVSNSGQITTIGVGIYSDNSCSNVLSSINWGTLDPGSDKTFTYYIRNCGNSPSILTLQTSNWSPSGAATYISLSWDYDGHVLNVDEVVAVTFTLSVSPIIDQITSFGFDITITGSST
jgi:FlaG/FlaF family flagellin (archaellin)